MCKPDELDTVGDFYDHAWGILNKSGRSFVTSIVSSVSYPRWTKLDYVISN